MPKASFYDDPDFSYQKYWTNRGYEDASEKLGVDKLLKKARFENASDIGGGFGRMIPHLVKYSRHVTLVEPSLKMRTTAKKFLKTLANVTVSAGTAQATGLDTNSQDLVTCFRVLHHIPDLEPVFVELARVTKPGGKIIVEFANSYHAKARINSLLSGKPILLSPIERRSLKHIRENTIPFVNHHPRTVTKLLQKHGFQINQILSVSNFRSQLLKKVLPLKVLVVLEYLGQLLLSGLYFGPSIFVLATKVDK